MHKIRKNVLWILVIGALFSCNKTTTTDSDEDDSEAAASTSAVGRVASGDSGIRNEPVTRMDINRAASCSPQRCNQVSFTDCDNGEQRHRFSVNGMGDCPCVARSTGNLFNLDTDAGLRRIFGEVKRKFSTTNCAFTVAGTTIQRTLTNFHVRRGRRGRVILYYTGTEIFSLKDQDKLTIGDDDLKAYTGVSYSSGGTLTKDSDGDGFDELSIGGVHRMGFRKTTPSTTSEKKMHQTLYTSTPLKIKRDLTNGILTIGVGSVWNVAMNIIQVTKTITVNTDLVFSANCDHPISGKVTLESSGKTVSIEYTSDCGYVKIDGASATDIESAED